MIGIDYMEGFELARKVPLLDLDGVYKRVCHHPLNYSLFHVILYICILFYNKTGFFKKPL